MSDIKSNVQIDMARVCELAHFDLTDEEQAEFQGQLENILRAVSKLDDLDLTDVEPTLYGHPIASVFREDVNTPSLDREQVMDNAPARIGNEFKLPKIVE